MNKAAQIEGLHLSQVTRLDFMMFLYFLLFSVIGGFVGKYATTSKNGFLLLIGIALIWSLGSGPFWGLISLGELLFGFSIFKFYLSKKSD